MVGIVRWQLYVGRVDGVWYFGSAVLSAAELNLGKERPVRRAIYPVAVVVDGGVPDEVVVGFAELLVAFYVGVIDGGLWSTVCRVVAVLLKIVGQELNVLRKMNFRAWV